MTFAETLGWYLDRYGILATELCRATGISQSMMSRMRNGAKEPEPDSELLDRLARGIADEAARRGAADLASETVRTDLAEPLQATRFDMPSIVANLNALIEALNINASDLSRFLSFDASYLSRIRSGKRRPANVGDFCLGVAAFVSLNFRDTDAAVIASLTGCEEEGLDDRALCRETVYRWLTEQRLQTDSSVRGFLQKLDEFDLNEFLRALPINEQGASVLAVDVPEDAVFQGVTGSMEAELAWLAATLQGVDEGPAVFYSDMPLEEASQDPDFPQRWMAGVALLLKKGVRLDMIHDVERSAPEMMLGLEAWIPLYMTGQVSPFYLKNNRNRYFRHFLRSSGSAALEGEAVAGFPADARFRFTTDPGEVAYVQKRGRQLLSKAQPLMDIYRADDQGPFYAFIRAELAQEGQPPRRSIMPAPPVHTLSPELLERLIETNQVPSAVADSIRDYVRGYREAVEALCARSQVTDEVPLLSEEDFLAYPLSLPLSDLFLDQEVRYSYEDYQEHVRLTRAYAESHPSYRCQFSAVQPFRNIQIRIAEGRFALVSKNQAPAIHFVVRHPKLRQAIERLTIPLEGAR